MKDRIGEWNDGADKTAESGQVKKAEDRQDGFGNSWSDTMRIAWLLAGIHSIRDVPAFDEQAEIVTVWDDAEARNDEAETNMLAVQVELLGRSTTSALRHLGLDPEEEAKLRKQEREEEPEPAPVPDLKPVVQEPKIPEPAPEPKN